MKEETTVKPLPQYLWKEWVKPFLLVAIILGTLRSALADWNDVPTGSMKPTIVEGDRVVVNKLAYDLKVPFTTTHLATWDDPHRGDIVVLYSPANGMRLVKRVVGIPGDRIQMKNNVLVVNGKPASYEVETGSAAERSAVVLDEKTPWASMHSIQVIPDIPAMRDFGPVVVPSGEYFVLGDNRDNSQDSRYIGFIPREKIVGKAVAVAFSLNHSNYYLPRGDRWFRAID